MTDASPGSTNPARRLDRWLIVVLVAASAALLYGLRRYGLLISDDGYALYPAIRMLEGGLLYRDIYHFYAPLYYHVLEGLFALTGPSLLAARTLWMLFLLGSIAGMYRIARRFVPPATAWLPAATYALVPGPWHKAFYGLCSVAFLLALARALERKSAPRHLLLGTVCGVTLMTRQELGVAQLLVATGIVGLVPLWPLRPGSLRREEIADAARRVLLVCGGFVAAAAPVFAFYAKKGILPDMVDAVFVQAYRYSDRSFDSLLEFILGDFGTAAEGPGVGALLMISLLFGVVATGFLLRAIRIRGLDVRSSLAAALVAFLIPAVIQSYNPPLLVRFLQSAVCFYLLIPFVLSELSPRIRRPASLSAGLSLAFYVAFVIGGPQRVEPSDAYTGSMRSLGYSAPIGVLGEVFWIDAPTAIEIRLVQDFIAEHTRPDEPIFAAPLHPTYYLLLARPNPTAFLGDFSFADLAMSRERKASEMQRLLASETRYAVVDNQWWSRQADPDKPVLHTLLSAFAPVRFYGSMAILERTSSPERLGMHEIARRIRKRRSEPDDVTALREIIRKWPDEPVPHELLGQLLLAQRKFSAAATSLQTALRLDPANPRLRARLERARNPNAPRSPRRPLASP